MTTTIPLLTPSANQITIGRHGNSYTSDINRMIQCQPIDVTDLLAAGCTYAPDLSGALDNLSATVDPTVSNDNTQDFAIGSRWFNTSAKRVWACISAATGAAVWALDAGPQKSGSNLTCGTFVLNGATTVAVANTSVTAVTDIILMSLNVAGGTVGAQPHLTQAPTPGTGFSVVGTASDTSTYNYMIIHNAS